MWDSNLTRVERFARGFRRKGWASLEDVDPVSYLFTCESYRVCPTARWIVAAGVGALGIHGTASPSRIPLVY